MSEQSHKLRYSGSSRSAVDYLLLARETYESAKIEAEALQRRVRQQATKMLISQRKRFQHYKSRRTRRLAQRALLARNLHENLQSAAVINAQTEQTVTLAFEIARKIVASELSQSSQALLLQLRSVIARSLEPRPIVVHLSASDYTRISVQRDLLPANIELHKSEIEPGNAVIETQSGKITLSIMDSLRELSRCMRRRLQSEQVA